MLIKFTVKPFYSSHISRFALSFSQARGLRYKLVLQPTASYQEANGVWIFNQLKTSCVEWQDILEAVLILISCSGIVLPQIKQHFLIHKDAMDTTTFKPVLESESYTENLNIMLLDSKIFDTSFTLTFSQAVNCLRAFGVLKDDGNIDQERVNKILKNKRNIILQKTIVK